ncbi:MAG: phosphotransferase, partial [Rubrivivax sp.]|nr:phosphotransferase [Rubrivivax sp.]
QVGAMLARMHRAGQRFGQHQPHLRGLSWWGEVSPLVLPHLADDDAALLRDELAFQQALAETAAARALPRGPIHADLFRDNVMFDATAGEDRLCGFFDFYFAGDDTLLFDVAVCLNDWCCDLDSGRLDEPRARAFMQAYGAERPLEGAERRLLPALLRAAALRFWLSRLWDWHLPREASLLQPKDPGHFRRVLRHRIDEPWHPE